MITEIDFWLVLATSVIAYWLLPVRFRIGFLAISSFAYLLSVDSTSVLILAIWAHLFYFLAPIAARKESRGRITAFLVLSVLSCLAYFKYVPQFVDAFSSEPALHRFGIPLGISYFTFKLIHYAIEAGRGGFPNATLVKFYSYLFLFPIFTAGPIERFDQFLENRNLEFSLNDIVIGLTRIAHGLIKRFVIAQFMVLPLFGYVHGGDELLQRMNEASAFGVWRFCVLTFLYNYLEFSAYSDIAIGASRLFGFRIMENFNWPIVATNIGDFWQRWHLSLATWCQRYVYMPLIGATRNPYLAVFASFIVMGLWHSGSLGWLMWGLYHAVGISIFGYWTRLRRRRGWQGLDRPGLRYCGIPITIAFVSATAVFISLDGRGGLLDVLRIMLKLTFLG